MPAYVILDVSVKNPKLYKQYKKAGAPTISLYGGKPLARGGKTLVLEGDWKPKRVIVLEFRSIEEAKRWWKSPEYKKAKKLRHLSADTNAILIEGL